MTEAHQKTAVIMLKGVLGVVGSVGPAVLSWLQLLETPLRVCSLVVGITVGLLTIRSLLRRQKPGHDLSARGNDLSAGQGQKGDK